MVARIGKPAPEFTASAVVNHSFEDISLSQYKGKYVVLFFYPLDWTFVCPTEICAFSDRVAEFEALNTQVLACSVDSKFSHLAWIQQARNVGGIGEMNIPVLSDLSKSISKSYDVLIEDGPDAGIALRGLFIIDPEGTLRQITVNDLPVGRSVDEVLRLVKAFQFVAEHGEVCPANWIPGAKTIIPSPTKSKSFFEATNDESNKRQRQES